MRGYAYQIAASALAWLDLDSSTKLFLEVAEDFALVVRDALMAVQVKDTAGSGPITLNSPAVRAALASYVDLVERNPATRVEFHYLTTSSIGEEKNLEDRPAGEPGLLYWRKAARGSDVAPLRARLQGKTMPESVREFVRQKDDPTLRSEFLRKIHWDCAQPDWTALRLEINERLISLARTRFQIPPSEAPRLSDVVMHHVLEKSIIDDANQRYLTRAELDDLIDTQTRISLPRATIDEFAKLASTLARKIATPQTGEGVVQEYRLTSWFQTGSDLPPPRLVISRPAIEDLVANSLSTYGIAILFGGTGLGKSILARAVLQRCCRNYAIVDFRDVLVPEAQRRVEELLGHVGDHEGFLFDDLNSCDLPTIHPPLRRIVSAITRRDRLCIITCYRRPSDRTLTELGLHPNAAMGAPYFSEDEAGALVGVAGANAKLWGRIAHISGGFGHPQLVHAFTTGMQARSWPTSALGDLVSQGFKTEDIDAARETARRNLGAQLPSNARMMLYRTSLVIGRFDRELALRIGALPPPISDVGEALDQLVGPWIEAVGTGLYRVSPLASNFGNEMLPAADQKNVHELIATKLLLSRKIDASDANVVFAHALIGKSTWSLLALAHSVFMASEDVLDGLCAQFFLLRLARTDTHIYPDNIAVSVLLRLAQFRLLTAKNDNDLSVVLSRLFTEISEITIPELQIVSQVMGLSIILSTQSIANTLENWIPLLQRFITLTENDPELRREKGNFENSIQDKKFGLYGFLFVVGSFRLTSISRLESIFVQLDALTPSERNIFIIGYEQQPTDFSLFVDGAWVAEAQDSTLDWADAANRYSRMADYASKWGNRKLALRCIVARAVLFDEYGREPDTALHVVEESVAKFGSDIILSRARAKVLWRKHDYANALAIHREIADDLGRNDPVERAFGLREAAISAANTDDWNQAEIWFDEAAKASGAAQSSDLIPMAIGLSLDAAVASFKAGRPKPALIRIIEALKKLPAIDTERSLRGAYLHRVARHLILWLKAQITEQEILVDDKPAAMLPGACSNPDPPSAIKDSPVGHLDFAWYMLAEIEVASGEDVGVLACLNSLLSSGRIPVLELLLRKVQMETAIEKLDPHKFAKGLPAWVSAATYANTKASALRDALDIKAPARGDIPTLSPAELKSETPDSFGLDAMIAYCLMAVLRNQVSTISALETSLLEEFDGEFPGRRLFKKLRNEQVKLADLDEVAARAIALLRNQEFIPPTTIWIIGLRIFERCRNSHFKSRLLPMLASWLHGRWTEILETQRFHLTNPMTTVAPIQTALAMKVRNESFIAALLLASADAVEANLSAEYRELLVGLVGP